MQAQNPNPITDAGFGVYVHWPFCAQKCPYCDFNSHVRHKGWDEPRFLAAYLRELDWVAERVPPQSVQSVFFGGGTPSLMQPSTVGAILDHIAKHWRLAPHAEITLEANPGSVEAGRFQGYCTAGVNRVSIGVQSLDDRELKALGRIHTAQEARDAVALAGQVFDRYSFDLIYARPHQSVDAWRRELADALSLAGGHVSLYQLTIEDGTPFAERHRRGTLQVPDGEAARALFDVTQSLAQDAGLPAYEISNHASSGHESRHNLIYWRYGTYAGIGAGAHGRLVYDGKRWATETIHNPEAWCRAVETHGHGLSTVEPLSLETQADECLMMGLRLRVGVDLATLSALTGYAIKKQAVDDLMHQGFIEYTGGTFSYPPEPGDDTHDDMDFDWQLRGCLGPGLMPEPQTGATPVVLTSGHLRATADGRFVLNELVYRLAANLQPLRQKSPPHTGTADQSQRLNRQGSSA